MSRIANPKTRTELEALPQVRVISMAGPCFTRRYLIRRNPGSVTIGHWSTNHPDPTVGHLITERESYSWVHTEPCHSCTDHPETNYPNGYDP